MFRAGQTPGAPGGLTLVQPQFSGSYVLLADISEWEPDIADALYLAWSKAIIVRALYGAAHDDAAWYGGTRRNLLHTGGARFLGIYAYLVGSQSGAAQAQAFHKLVGAIEPGEVFIADYEEGSRAVLVAWYNEMITLYGKAIAPYLWTYTGLYFGEAEGVLPVQWLADYTSAEPSSPHKLWQFTDRYSVPGVGTCDCSVFRGSIDQLAALAYQGAKPPPTPAPPPSPSPIPAWETAMMNTLPTLKQGDADHPGAAFFVHRAQALCSVIGHINNIPAAVVTQDGSFGPATASAVKAIQKFFGITQDGSVGPQTWGALVTGAPA